MKLMMNTITLLLADYTGEMFQTDLLQLISYIAMFVGVLMTLYAVYIAYLFATASDDGKRRSAKARLIKVLASVLIVAGLVSIIQMLDIRFNNIDLPNSGKGEDDVNITSYSFWYDGEPSMTLSPGSTVSFVVYPTLVKSNDSSKRCTQITNIQFDEIPLSNFVLDSRYSQCKWTMPSDYVENTNNKISVYKSASGEFFVKAKLSFSYTDSNSDTPTAQQGTELIMWVKLNSFGNYENLVDSKWGSSNRGQMIVYGTKV